jgi:hypothetical protein
VLDAAEFIHANRDRRSEWIPEKTVHTRDGQQVTVNIDVKAFATLAWRKVLRHKDRPGMLACHLEVCVFSCLAAERIGRHRGRRVGLLRRPGRAADVLGGVRAAGGVVLRAGRHPD